jgi:hypothetical protein
MVLGAAGGMVTVGEFPSTVDWQELGRYGGMATILSEMGHRLHEIFT